MQRSSSMSSQPTSSSRGAAASGIWKCSGRPRRTPRTGMEKFEESGICLSKSQKLFNGELDFLPNRINFLQPRIRFDAQHVAAWGHPLQRNLDNPAAAALGAGHRGALLDLFLEEELGAA